MTAVSTANAEHYQWGDGCDGWHFLKNAQLSVIRERVPAGKGEVRHRHCASQQFFFILSGSAEIEVEGRVHWLQAEGCHVAAGCTHQFTNRSNDAVEFLVVS